jgi:hypothetical protein
MHSTSPRLPVAGLVPAIHVLNPGFSKEDVGAWHKAGHGGLVTLD